MADNNVIFYKPWYAQGWFLALVSGILLACGAIVLKTFNNNPAYLGFAAGISVFFLMGKLAFGITAVELTEEDIRVHCRSRVNIIPYEHSTITYDKFEVYIVRRGEFFSGSTLRRMYWPGVYDNLLQHLMHDGSYVRDMDEGFSETGLGSRYAGALPSNRDMGGSGGFYVSIKFLLGAYDLLMGLIVIWPLHALLKNEG